MSRFLRLSLLVTVVMLMIACGLSATSADPNAAMADISVVRLTVQPPSSDTPYNTVGQVINYIYTVQNTGSSPLAGPVIINDSKTTPQCLNLNTIGNQNEYLDANESVTCTASYNLTQADINAGSVTSTATARVGTIDSNQVTTVVPIALNQVLTITATANPASYSQLGQIITYNYTITNTGTQTLGPAQFVVVDDRIPTPINCGTNVQTLAPNESVTCSASYTISQGDTGVAQITSSVSASGAGAGTILPAVVIVTNSNIASPGGTPASNIARGSTVQHNVISGDWMLQISRCYGADFTAVQRANPQVIDPDLIYPLTRVTVPNVGSNGTIYGPPCVVFYTVLSGDTWESIARNHNADVVVLREANKDVTLAAGRVLKVPINSAGVTTTIPTAVPTTAPVREPIRLNFPAGSPTVIQSGTIGTPDTIRYVFNGTTGQILTVRLNVSTNDVSLAVYGPDGTALKPLDLTNSWSGTLTANGDHFIDLVSTLGSTNKSYTLEVTLTTPAPASPVERVADINPGSGDSNPSHLAVFNGQLYFQANANDGAGAELWRYDQGLNAVSRVADINQGDGGSEPAFLTPFNDMLYFRANGNDGAGIELWRFNGSATGRVTDQNSGMGDFNPMYLTVFNGALYFSANGNDGAGIELWRYDGTVSTRVTDINPDAGDSSPAYMEVFNNELYFSATSNDGAGTELWKFDGTTPTRVADINEGVGNSSPAFLAVFNNALYFSANANDGAGTELWRFDGTTAGRAADINPGAADSVPTYLTVFNNALYFSANGDSAGFELWRFDGTNASRVADINPAGNANPAYLTVYNNELYFQANGNDGAGAELWKFKGP
jgi:ELWxxDGT repeat protein